MNNNFGNLKKAQTDAKYAQGRSSLLIAIVFSAINIISIPFADVYFLFSSFFSTMLTSIGAAFYAETGDIYYPAVYCTLSVITLVPYLICWIFSKKHYGWMIGALVLFSIDTLLLLLLTTFETSMIIDIVFHAYVLICLIQGVLNGKKAKKLKDEEPILTEVFTSDNAPAEAKENVRSLTLVREKKFASSLVKFTVLINGKFVDSIGNGETKVFPLTEDGLCLGIISPDGTMTEECPIPAGYNNVTVKISSKVGAFGNKIILTPEF